MEKTGKRDNIIQAALELIAEYGFHGTSMAMIAAKADVGAGTIYRYFSSKEALINELYKELEDKIMAIIEKNYPSDKSIRERFLHIGTTLISLFTSNPIYFRYVEQYHNSPFGVSFRRDKLLSKSGDDDIVKNLFEEGIAQEVLKNLPLMAQFALFFGPLITIIRDHILGFIILDEDLTFKTIEACWDGIKK